MKFLSKKNLFLALVLLFFLAGFYLRLSKYLTFNYLRGDEGNHFILFDNLLRFKKFWLVGEASSFGDYDLKLYLHNSPYSLYFELIIFILANQSPLIYMFFYILINLAVVYLLWQTSKNFFNEKVAFLVLFLAIFSKHMIAISVYASQPTNALIFETIGLYLLSLFYRKKKNKLLIFGLISLLFAVHMYPPMHLYLPVKIIFLLAIFHKEIKKNKKILIYALIIIIISYLPMIINEKNYFNQDCSNLWNIKSLINNGGFNVNNKSLTTNDKTWFIQLLENIIFISRDTFNNINANFYAHALLLIPILLSAIFLNKNKTTKILVCYFILSILSPIFFLSIFKIDRLDYICGLNSFYLVFLLAIGIVNLRKISKSLYFLSTLFVSILVFTGIEINKPLEPEFNYINFLERQLILKSIKNEINNDSLSLSDINIKVINNDFPNNNGNWDSSIYWYLLQRESSDQLVESSYPFLTPEIINKKPNLTFYICEYKEAPSDAQDCFKKIDEFYYVYNDKNSQLLFQNKRLILIKNVN